MIDYGFVKRSLDALGAAGLLVLASPALGITALMVRRNLGRPVLFTQERPGRAGKTFRMYKFRSMKDVDPEAGLVTDEERLTDFGRWLRSTSLDELPSLLNVLKGDMSFVGPRPLLVSYLDRYTPEQARRHEVRPGITGLAQVSGRNLVDWEERFRLDVEYVDNMTLRTDARILLQTVSAVFRRHGISADGQATMSEFTGSPLPASSRTGVLESRGTST
ncbi:sugar transferase [Citricoccus sp. SGAir0253]|uniref:sugar transferase n=1 Tax=Citricoccus sp. SGAir0253 TaxID=2567881 RepID=UPI0010CCFBAF|nr:sugar transferase [Citricoccus sp. SGAir0253]QCU77544.1 sugar transferase [Citricoccus sp. SGAir0253]